MSEWISVKDRLPVIGDTVLVAFPSGAGDAFILTAYLRVDNGRFAFTGSGIECNPTHWQPLPEPPPKPDAFEEWFMPQRIQLSGDMIRTPSKMARVIWDAAIASVKDKP